MSHKSLRVGGTTKAQTFQQNTAVFCVCKNNSRYKHKDCSCFNHLGKAFTHKTADFHVCEADPDLQRSSLNAAPLS